MRTRALLTLLLVLVLALAACGDDDKKDEDQKPTSTAAPAATPLPEAEGTEPVETGGDYSVFTPGIMDPVGGVSLQRYSQGETDDTIYFFAEVRNDSPDPLRLMELTIYMLDAQGYRFNGSTPSSLLAEDIPAGQVVYLGTTFQKTPDYADMQVWVTGSPVAEASAYKGYYNLPATIDYQGPGSDGIPYTVRGTVQNNTDRELLLIVINLGLIGPDDNLVGVANTQTMTGTIAPGASAPFEVMFPFLAAESTQITDVKVVAAGYSTP